MDRSHRCAKPYGMSSRSHLKAASAGLAASAARGSFAVDVLHNQQRIPTTYAVCDDEVEIALTQPVIVEAGELLQVEFVRQ